MKLHNTVVLARKTKGLTQSELAARVKVSRQTIAAIEKNDYSPSAILAFLLAEALEAPVQTLFQLQEED